MKIKFSKDIPNKLEKVINGILIRYNITEVSEEEIVKKWKQQYNNLDGYPDNIFINNNKYKYSEIRIPQGRVTYEKIVEDLIRDKYTIDEMEAITNNLNAVISEFFSVLITDGIIKATKYLVDSVDDEKMKQFKEMQEWRAFAKKTAKEIFNNGTIL